MGIETLKKAVKTLVDFGEAISAALDDGKVSFMEIVGIAIDTTPDVIAIIPQAVDLKAEWDDLDMDEANELSEYFADELDLNEDGVEEVVESAFRFALALNDLIDSIGDAKN